MTMSNSVAGIGQTEHEALYIGGKRFAGGLSDVNPFYGFGSDKDSRCIVGFLSGPDHHGRGFDNRHVRTSVVKEVLVHQGNMYAITMNSAYLLENINIMAFITSGVWRDDIIKAMSEGMKDSSLENGVKSVECSVVYHVTSKYFQETLLGLQPVEWVVKQEEPENKTLVIGNKIYIDDEDLGMVKLPGYHEQTQKVTKV